MKRSLASRRQQIGFYALSLTSHTRTCQTLPDRTRSGLEEPYWLRSPFVDEKKIQNSKFVKWESNNY